MAADEKSPKEAVPTKPRIETAKTSRSKCQGCKEPIENGSKRVGFPGRAVGGSLTVTKWLHPACFARNLVCDYAPTGRAKCAEDGTAIEKGTPRLLMRMISCRGDVNGQKIYKLASAAPFLAELLQLDGVSAAASITALCASLEPAHRAYAEKALSGADVSGLSVPTCEEPESKPKAKAKAKAKPKPKRAKAAASPAGKAEKASQKRARLAEPASDCGDDCPFGDAHDDDDDDDEAVAVD